MQNIITYFTETDLPVEAQRSLLNYFTDRVKCRNLGEYIEDDKWKGLEQAVEHANRSNALLVIPKLGRLISNLKFTSILQNTAEFICLDKQEINHTTIAVVANAWETNLRKNHLQREAFSRLKESGVQIASANPDHWKNVSKKDRRKFAKKAAQIGSKARRDRTEKAYELLMPLFRKMETEETKIAQEHIDRGKEATWLLHKKSVRPEVQQLKEKMKTELKKDIEQLKEKWEHLGRNGEGKPTLLETIKQLRGQAKTTLTGEIKKIKRLQPSRRALKQAIKVERKKHAYPIYEAIAKRMNELGHRTVFGKVFNGTTVYRILKRYEKN